MSQSTHSKNKKSAVLNSRKRKYNPMVILLGLTLMLTIGAFAYYVMNAASPARPADSIHAKTEGSEVSYPVSLFADGKARHFYFMAGNLTIRYFILKSSDGVIRAAFDACDVCWPAGKGYYQEGDHMVCRNCGRRFASVRVNEVQGGCNPAPLMRQVKGDHLILTVDDIVKGRSYFNFNKQV